MNKNHISFTRLVRATCLILVLAVGSSLIIASGGGGGGGGGNNLVPVVPAMISEINAPVIASATVRSTAATGSIAGAGGGILGVGSAPVMAPGKAHSATNASVAYATVGPETEQCAAGGSITISATINNPNALLAGQLQPGDSFTTDSNNCDLGGIIYSGGFDFDVLSFNGDIFSNFYAMTLDLDAANFTIRIFGEDTVAMNGSIQLGLNFQMSPASTVTMSGDELTLTVGSESATLFDFSLTESSDGATLATTTIDSTGSLGSPSFAGRVSYDTTVPFQYTGSNSAYVGTMEITGAEGTRILVTAVDENSVQLDIDSDGDGLTDVTRVMTWQELYAS